MSIEDERAVSLMTSCLLDISAVDGEINFSLCRWPMEMMCNGEQMWEVSFWGWWSGHKRQWTTPQDNKQTAC